MRRLFAVLLLLALTVPPAAAQVSDREIPFGDATTLRLNVNGSIHVVPLAGATNVAFHAVDYGPSVPPMAVTTSRAGKRLNISITGPSQNLLPFNGASGYELYLTYPASAHLDLRAFAGRVHVDAVPAPMEIYAAQGDIVVDSTAHSLAAEDDSGSITVTNARNTLMLTTSSGDVKATLAPGWRGSLVRLEASHGNLALHVPAGFRGRYDLSSGSGSVRNALHSVAGAPLVFMLAEQGSIAVATP
jgi:hypothetical protein